MKPLNPQKLKLDRGNQVEILGERARAAGLQNVRCMNPKPETLDLNPKPETLDLNPELKTLTLNP